MFKQAVIPSSGIKMLTADKLKQWSTALALPLLGLTLFLALWNVVAQNIDTSLGKFPGPVQVLEQSKNLINEAITNL